ncbi:MAG: hypothetical protein JW955_07255 [Sedimentisphaerales bacterium]|nr:hypothetical protein [Sedimentisphaerales bacterium]
MQRVANSLWLAVLILMPLFAASACGAATGAILVDHNCVDVSAIPGDYVSAASSLRVLVRHASVGQGIIWGLDCLAGAHPTNSACSCFPAGKYDRSRWVFEARMGNWREKIDDLVTQTAARLDDFDVFMMKFCYIDALGDSHPDWEYFRSRMEKLEADYPCKTFVWWTIPLTRDGQAGTDWFNAQIRAHCATQGKILFDIADIECHEADGTKLLNAGGNEIISANYTKEIHAGHLNPTSRVRVASAFWHLMARIAGWNPCRCVEDFDLSEEAFELTLGEKASWSQGREGYDPNLPGYHVAGDIASVTIRAKTDALPCELVLAIQTSPGMAPMLEDFVLVSPDVRWSGEPFNPDTGLTCLRKVACRDEWEVMPVNADTYFTFEIRGDEVCVTFLPDAIELLRAECTISWIDWYR